MKNKHIIQCRFLMLIILSTLINTIWIFIADTKPYSDFLYYHQLAEQISRGGTWGDTYTTAGYSVILGFVYGIFGPNILVAKFFNVFCTTVSNILFYLILKKCNISSKFTFFSVLIFSIYPANIMYNSVLANEIIFTLIILLILYVYLNDVRGKYIVGGLLIGLASMMKPFFIAFGLCILIVDIIVFSGDFRKVLFSNVICFITVIICVTPWVIRNTLLIGQFTFISNNGGIVLYINNNSDNYTGKWIPADNITNSITRSSNYINSNATEKNNMLKKAAKQWILSHPKKFLELGHKRLYNTFYLVDDLDYALYGIPISDRVQHYLVKVFGELKTIMSNSLLVFLIVSASTLFRKKRNRNDMAFKLNTFVLIMMMFFILIYFIAEGQGRYSFPLNFICAYSLPFLIHWFSLAIKESIVKYKHSSKLYRT